MLCPEVRQAGGTQWTRETTHTRPIFTLQDDHTDVIKNTDNILEMGVLKRANFEIHWIHLGALWSLGMYFPLYTQGATDYLGLLVWLEGQVTSPSHPQLSSTVVC